MNYAKRWLPALVGVALIVLLLRQIDLRELLRLLLGADPKWLLVGAFWYSLTNVLRAYRFGVLLQMRGRWTPFKILPEMFAMSLLNNVLPSRTGELSFPYFLYRNHDVAVGESATVLILARIFDYLAVATLFVIFAFLTLNELEPQAASIVGVVAFLLLLSTGALLIAPWLGDAGFRLANWLFKTEQRPESRSARFLSKAHFQVVTTLQRVRNVPIYMKTAGWSLLIWLATFAWFGAFMQAIDLPQPYPTVVVGSTFASLAKALPFVTIGGFGAHEAGWALGFSLTGMETTVAITSGFAVNILTLLMSLIFGGAALLYMNWRKASKPQMDTDKRR